jgi:chromosome segregation ATPase
MSSRVEGVNKSDNKRKFITSETQGVKELLHVTMEQGETSNDVIVTEGTLTEVELLSSAPTLETKLDTVNTSIGSTNTKLDTLHSDVDGVETAIGSTNTKLDTLHSDVDGVETAIGATNTKLDTLHSDVDGLEALTLAINNLITELVESNNTLHMQMNAMNRPIWYDQSVNSIRMVPNAAISAAQSGTWNITTLTGITQRASMNISETDMRWAMDQRWALQIRANIS